MSKRFKVRQRNAAKQERSREVIGQFYHRVIDELKRIEAMSDKERDKLLAALKT